MDKAEQPVTQALKPCPNAEAIAQEIADRTRWKKNTDTYARIYQAAYAGAIAALNTRTTSLAAQDDVARPEVFSRAIVHLQKELQKALDDATTLSAENEKLRRALREAPAALNAMAAQVEAEFRDHDKAAARHDAIVMAFKKKVRQALAGDDHGHR